MAFLFEERPCSVLLVLAPAEHGDLRPISDFQAIQAFVSGVHDAVSNTGALTVAVKLLAGMSGVTRAMLQRLSAVCCMRGQPRPLLQRCIIGSRPCSIPSQCASFLS